MYRFNIDYFDATITSTSRAITRWRHIFAPYIQASSCDCMALTHILRTTSSVSPAGSCHAADMGISLDQE